MNFANTPKAPYYAVIFTSIRNNEDEEEYQKITKQMTELLENQPGFLGFESARETVGITVSYWKDIDAIKNWKMNEAHLTAQQKGKAEFYKAFKVRICKVERDYSF